MSDEHRMDALSRHWNALVRGEAPPNDVDPDLAGALDWALSRDDAPAPDPAFVARLEDDLMRPSPTTSAPAIGGQPARNGHPPFPLNRLVRFAPPVEREHHRPGFARLAVAAVFLLAVGLGAIAIGRGWGPEAERRNTIPAAVAPSTPGREAVRDEVLLEITLPAEALPRGEEVSSGLGHFSIPPKTRSVWGARQPYCCPGPLVEYVVAGAYAVRAEAPTRVVRAGGAVDEVPAGVETVLHPGDALISRSETVVEAANPGETAVDLVHWILIDDPNSTFNGHLLPGWDENDIDVKYNQTAYEPARLSVPAGAATVRLRRVERGSDATFPAPPSGVTSFAVTLHHRATGPPAAGTAIGTQSDGTIRNLGQTMATVYVLTLEPAEPGATASPTP